ncbi:MAG: C-GCAxxG-C-C family protein [Thermodesulfobacteriota bacterium]
MLAGFGPRFDLDEATALKLGRPFGSGLGQGLICGAVIGSFQVLGLSRGEVAEDEQKNRYATYDLVREFQKLFRERRGSVVCRDLLGVDLGTEEGGPRPRSGISSPLSVRG